MTTSFHLLCQCGCRHVLNVHGHYQCVNCGLNLYPCCSGEIEAGKALTESLGSNAGLAAEMPVGVREFCPICGDEELCERPADCPELFETSNYLKDSVGYVLSPTAPTDPPVRSNDLVARVVA